MSPFLDSKPFETQDWQFYSVALGLWMRGSQACLSPFSVPEESVIWFLFNVLFMSYFYWSKPYIAQLLATVILLISCVDEDYGWFLEILGLILWEYRGDFFFLAFFYLVFIFKLYYRNSYLFIIAFNNIYSFVKLCFDSLYILEAIVWIYKKGGLIRLLLLVQNKKKEKLSIS